MKNMEQYKNCHSVMHYAKKLEHHHQIFYTLVSLNDIYWDNSIPTACIEYHKAYDTNYLKVSADFFEKLNEQTQLFVLAHECMHVIFNHPLRTLKEKKDAKLSNIAQDIVINELLIREFNFNKKDIDVGFDMCFVDTVFSKEQIKEHNIKKNESFNYYYKILKKLQPEQQDLPELLDPDSHENINDNEQKIEQQAWEQIMDALGNDLDQEERQGIIDIMSDVLKDGLKKDASNSFKAGTQALGQAYDLELTEQEDNNYWEKIVEKQISSLQKQAKNIKEKEHFRAKPRRLAMLSDDMFIPDVYEEEEKGQTNDKFNLFFFLDSSGSCIGYAQDFFNLVRTIPEESFNIHLFSFDTNVYELNKDNPKVLGGGGTAFNIIEQEIQHIIKTNPKQSKNTKKNNSYPDLVFVLTDGMGNHVAPERPEKWYWILTPHNTTKYIHPKSHKIKIEDIKNKNNIRNKKKQYF